MRPALAILVLLVGCDRFGATCDTTWSVPLQREGSDEGTDTAAAIAPDGSIIVAFSDSASRVEFGSTTYVGAHLARVGADGTIGSVVDGPALPYAAVLAVDDANGPIVVWGFNPTRLVAYDAALSPRWSAAMVGRVYGEGVVAVGPRAEVAYTTMGIGNAGLRFLGSDGVERWQLDGPYTGHGRFMANGDLVVFRSDPSGAQRVVVRADGVVQRMDPAAVVPTLVAPDGDSILSGFDASGATYLERRAPDDSLRWRRTLDVRATSDLRFGASGELVLFSYGEIHAASPQHFDVRRFDGATGEPLASRAVCEAGTLIGTVSDGGVITLGPTGSASRGLSRYD